MSGVVRGRLYLRGKYSFIAKHTQVTVEDWAMADDPEFVQGDVQMLAMFLHKQNVN